MIAAVKGKEPDIHESCFVASDASVIGDVTLGKESSVWPHASVRADSDRIRIGKRTSVQDNTVIHTADGYPVVVGDGVTIGHRAIVHGCTVADDVLIGMGAIVLSGAEIGTHSIIAAGAVVTEETEIPERSMVMGVPGEVVRDVTEEEIKEIRENARVYVEKAKKYKESFAEL